ncbi:hypothetical protein D3C80_1476820 [compost metagenome]
MGEIHDLASIQTPGAPQYPANTPHCGQFGRDVRRYTAPFILYAPLARLMEQHVIGDHGFYLEPLRHVGKVVQPHLVVRPPAQTDRHISTVAEHIGQFPHLESTGIIAVIRHHNAYYSVRIGDHIVPIENAVVLAAAAFSERDQSRQPGMGEAICGINQHPHAVLQIERAADD